MTRQTILFAVLVAVGLAAAWWALLYNPMSATIAETYGQADTTRTQVAAARSDLAELERVADLSLIHI